MTYKSCGAAYRESSVAYKGYDGYNGFNQTDQVRYTWMKRNPEIKRTCKRICLDCQTDYPSKNTTPCSVNWIFLTRFEELERRKIKVYNIDSGTTSWYLPAISEWRRQGHHTRCHWSYTPARKIMINTIDFVSTWRYDAREKIGSTPGLLGNEKFCGV